MLVAHNIFLIFRFRYCVLLIAVTASSIGCAAALQVFWYIAWRQFFACLPQQDAPFLKLLWCLPCIMSFEDRCRLPFLRWNLWICCERLINPEVQASTCPCLEEACSFWYRIREMEREEWACYSQKWLHHTFHQAHRHHCARWWSFCSVDRFRSAHYTN